MRLFDWGNPMIGRPSDWRLERRLLEAPGVEQQLPDVSDASHTNQSA
jgi:hypothetical protein